MLSAPLVLAGQLLGFAFACGLNLYATVALVGMASRLGLVTDLPPGMLGLENALIIGIATGLYVVEFIADRVPVLDTTWEAVHTLIRPAAAALLVFLALHDASDSWQILGTAAAFFTALASHTAKTGLRLILASRNRGPTFRRQSLARVGLSVVEDLLAIGIAVAALLHPAAATIVVGTALLVLLVLGPRLWRAAALAVRATSARTRGFFGGRGWRTREQVPRYLRGAIPLEPLGRSPARAIPVAVTGLPRVGAYRNGWLVFTCDGPRFLYRSFFRSRWCAIPHVADVTVQRGIMTDALDVRTQAGSGRNFTIYLLKDGAPPHIAASELAAESR
jgi:hypothetical protein